MCVGSITMCVGSITMCVGSITMCVGFITNTVSSVLTGCSARTKVDMVADSSIAPGTETPASFAQHDLNEVSTHTHKSSLDILH